jgi:hypothetical protein
MAISCLVDLPARLRPCLFLYLATIGQKSKRDRSATTPGSSKPLRGRFLF